MIHWASFFVGAACVALLTTGTVAYLVSDIVPTAATDAARIPRGCTVADIVTKSVRAEFLDLCSSATCYYLRGVATLTNNCRKPTGVQVKIAALDESGATLFMLETWPASTRNIPPGDYEFSLDSYFKYDGRIHRLAVTPIAVREWQSRERDQ